MTIEQLLYFVTAYDTGSFTKTSKAHYISQPAVSSAIKLLEEEFSTELFTRNNNKLAPTPAADYLYTIARPIVTLYNNLGPQMRNYVTNTTQIKIGIPPMLGGFIFAPVFDKFLQKSPHTNVKLVELASSANQEAVDNDEIDLALTVIHDEEKLPSLEYRKIGETQLVFAVRNGHPLAVRHEIGINELGNIPLLLMKEDSLQYKVVIGEFKKANINPNIRLLTNQVATIKELLAYGNIGAFLFTQVIKENDDIVGIPLKENITFDIVLATKKNKTISKQTKKFYDFIADNYADK